MTTYFSDFFDKTTNSNLKYFYAVSAMRPGDSQGGGFSAAPLEPVSSQCSCRDKNIAPGGTNAESFLQSMRKDCPSSVSCLRGSHEPPSPKGRQGILHAAQLCGTALVYSTQKRRKGIVGICGVFLVDKCLCLRYNTPKKSEGGTAYEDPERTESAHGVPCRAN